MEPNWTHSASVFTVTVANDGAGSAVCGLTLSSPGSIDWPVFGSYTWFKLCCARVEISFGLSLLSVRECP